MVLSCKTAEDGSLVSCTAYDSTNLNIQLGLNPGVVIHNNTLFISDFGNDGLASCTISDGALSNCTSFKSQDLPGANLSDPADIVVKDDYLYIANYAGTGISRCTIEGNKLSNCTSYTLSNDGKVKVLGFDISNKDIFITAGVPNPDPRSRSLSSAILHCKLDDNYDIDTATCQIQN
jgi:hypothetical protein